MLKRVAVKLSKICNDLRLLSSGPRAGLGEINLPAVQSGSSIMPGKINPVIPEVVSQVAYEVIGNDVTVTMAAEAGQLQLNAFEPIIVHSLHKSISHLEAACRTLTARCIRGITANTERLRLTVEQSIGLVTALNPHIGYASATAIAQEALATGKGVAELVLEHGLLTLASSRISSALNAWQISANRLSPANDPTSSSQPQRLGYPSLRSATPHVAVSSEPGTQPDASGHPNRTSLRIPMTNPITDHTVPPQAHATEKLLHAEDTGYHKDLKPRQIQMIAIGGAIGTGLFLGAGGRLNAAGPSLVIAYAVCGFFAFLILRALGELVLHRPSSGSFVSYAREFFGEKAAFVSGWFYWINWATTTIVDITAAALYMNFFGKYVPWMGAVPQWAWALIALVVVLSLNLVSVKVFGEMEFWFALIKVAALVAFLLVGTYLRHLRHPGTPASKSASASSRTTAGSSPTAFCR